MYRNNFNVIYTARSTFNYNCMSVVTRERATVRRVLR